MFETLFKALLDSVGVVAIVVGCFVVFLLWLFKKDPKQRDLERREAELRDRINIPHDITFEYTKANMAVLKTALDTICFNLEGHVLPNLPEGVSSALETPFDEAKTKVIEETKKVRQLAEKASVIQNQFVVLLIELHKEISERPTTKMLLEFLFCPKPVIDSDLLKSTKEKGEELRTAIQDLETALQSLVSSCDRLALAQTGILKKVIEKEPAKNRKVQEAFIVGVAAVIVTAVFTSGVSVLPSVASSYIFGFGAFGAGFGYEDGRQREKGNEETQEKMGVRQKELKEIRMDISQVKVVVSLEKTNVEPETFSLDKLESVIRSLTWMKTELEERLAAEKIKREEKSPSLVSFLT